MLRDLGGLMKWTLKSRFWPAARPNDELLIVTFKMPCV